MIDPESELFDLLEARLTEKFPDITLDSVTTFAPTRFPYVCIEQTDNKVYTKTSDSGSLENHAQITLEVNVYSNREGGKKAECKAILGEIDTVLCTLGFIRTVGKPFVLDDATKYRLFARYTAVVSKNFTVYRR